ncbi:MAG: hypothetical protein WD688_08465 [Candidatus Binatia bacterium]
MARAGIVSVPKRTVTQLTNADVAGDITFQHIRGDVARVIGTTTATAPSVADFDNGVRYQQLEGERGTTLAALFPGASYVRLWAYTTDGAAFVVYHA